jgi:hypothetical protein
MTSAIENVHRVVQQFNHQLFDYGREIQHESVHIESTSSSIKSVLRVVGHYDESDANWGLRAAHFS